MIKVDKRREYKKLSMRKAREKMRSNPEAYEEQKKKDRERKKKHRKKISEMSECEKRKIREGWKERTKKSRENKNASFQKTSSNSPPNLYQPSDCLIEEQTPPTPRKHRQTKQRERNRKILIKKIKMLEEKNKLQREVFKCRKMHYTLRNKIADSPQKLPVFCGLNDEWSTYEEMILLESIQNYSHGNWTKIAEILTEKFKKNFTPEEVCDHYNNTYLEGDIAEAMKGACSDIFRCSVTDHTSEEEDAILKSVDMNAHKNVPPECLKEIGYMPLREDFKVEYQPNTEDLIQHLTFSNVDAYDKNVNLILLDLYRAKIEQRVDVKTTIKKHRLVEMYFSTDKPCIDKFLVSSLLYSKSTLEILHMLLQNSLKNDTNEASSLTKRKTRKRLKKNSVRKNRKKKSR